MCMCVCGHHSCQFSKVIRQHINICIYVVDTVAKQTPALSSLLSAVLLFEEEEQQQFCFGVEQCEVRTANIGTLKKIRAKCIDIGVSEASNAFVIRALKTVQRNVEAPTHNIRMVL